MKKLTGVLLVLALMGCEQSSTGKEKAVSERQQQQYLAGQPIPSFDWSLERHLVIELYKLRNQKVSTHTVWRSDRGMIEGDCPSIGFSVPYDTSLTNPLMTTSQYHDSAVVEQSEPNGIFASKNTAATWVMCLGDAGNIEPVYVETKVTTYPYPVKVDYQSNLVTKTGKAAATISVN